MDFSALVLGKTAANKLVANISAPLLIIGSDRFTRQDLSRVDCFNFIAAGNINRAIKDLGAKNTRDLFTHYPPALLALPHIGVIALAVLGAAFEAKGLGGDHPLEAWVSRHTKNGNEGIRTFLTMKQRAQQEASAERKEAKQRKQSRKNRAHQIRTKRFIERAADQPVPPERTET